MGVIFSMEMKNPNFQVVSKEDYQHKIARSKSNNLAEQEQYLGDSASTPLPKKKKADDGFWQLDQPDPATGPSRKTPPAVAENSGRENEIFVSRGLEGYLIYDCSRFFNFDGKKYIIQEGTYASWNEARQKLDLLRKEGIESMALLLSCFSKTEKGYAVHVGMIYNSEEEARREFGQLQLTENPALKEMRNWKIRPIEPVIQQ